MYKNIDCAYKVGTPEHTIVEELNNMAGTMDLFISSARRKERDANVEAETYLEAQATIEKRIHQINRVGLDKD